MGWDGMDGDERDICLVCAAKNRPQRAASSRHQVGWAVDLDLELSALIVAQPGLPYSVRNTGGTLCHSGSGSGSGQVSRV